MALADLLGTKRLAKTLEETKEYTFQNIKVSQAAMNVSKEQMGALLEINKSIHALKDVFEGQLTKAARDRYEKFALDKTLLNAMQTLQIEQKRRSQEEKIRQSEDEERRKEEKNDQKGFFNKLGEKLSGKGKNGGSSMLDNLLGGFGKAIALAFAPFIAAFTAPALIAGIGKMADFFAGFMQKASAFGKAVGTMFGGAKGGSIGSLVAQITGLGAAIMMLMSPIKSLRLLFRALSAPVRMLMNMMKGGGVGSAAGSAAGGAAGAAGKAGKAGKAGRLAGLSRVASKAGSFARAAAPRALGVAGAAIGGWEIGTAMHNRASNVSSGKADRTMLDELNPAQHLSDFSNSVTDKRLAQHEAIIARVAKDRKYSQADIEAIAKQYEVGDWWVTDEDRQRNQAQVRKQLDSIVNRPKPGQAAKVAPAPSAVPAAVTQPRSNSSISNMFEELAKQVTEGGIIVRIADAASGMEKTKPDFSNVVGSSSSTVAAANNIPKTDIEHAVESVPMNSHEELIRRQLTAVGITDPKEQAAVLGNLQAESGLKPKSENLNYSGKRLMQVMPKYFSGIDDANAIAAQGPEAIGNRIYGGRMGNAANEGYKYRGRGYIQLTGKDNYRRYSKMAFGDERLVDNPDLLNDPEVAARVAALYLKDRTKGKMTSENVTRAIAPANMSAEIRERQELSAQFERRSPNMSSIPGTAIAAAQVREEDKKRRAAERRTASVNAPVVSVSSPTYNSSSTGVALGATTDTHDSYYKDMVA